MIYKGKIRILVSSVTVMSIMIVAWIVFPLLKQQPTDNFYLISSQEVSVNNDFNYLSKSTSGISSKHHSRRFNNTVDTLSITSGSFIKNDLSSMGTNEVNFARVSVSYSSKSNKQNEYSSGQVSSPTGLYFSKNKNRSLSDNLYASNYSSNLSINSGQNSNSFVGGPQRATSGTNDGGDPGGDPTGPPLPLSDGLVILILLASVYTIKKSRLL